MDEFMSNVLAYPTLLLTTGVVLVALYWGLVLVSGAGFGGEMEGTTDGTSEALSEGATELAESVAGWSIFPAWIGLGKAPLSVLLSVWTVSAWVLCYLLMRTIGPMSSLGPLRWVLGLGVVLVALFLTMPVVRLVGGALEGVFRGSSAESRADLIGRSCTITTGTADASFGQARVNEGGDWRIIQVRCATTLARGDRALILSWDSKADAFQIEPIQNQGGAS